MANITDYTDIITSEHADKPNFIAVVELLCGAPLPNLEIMQGIAAYIDVEQAVGAQLDVIGEWIGRSRQVDTPLTGVYFSFDTADVGFDEGVWLGPYDPTTGLESLPDDSYRQLLLAVIALNSWDGSIPYVMDVWATLFPNYNLIIQDYANMTMAIGVVGSTPDAVLTALIKGGYLDPKPSGVELVGYYAPSVANTPFFGFDAETNAVSGFDVGSWATSL